MAGKTFRFSLQRVLDLRHREAEEAERALGHAVRERRAQEERLAEARQQRADACASTPEGAFDPAALRRRAGHLDDLRTAEAEAVRKLSRLRQKEKEARRTLVKRRQPEEALRVLRDNESAAHLKTQAEAEMAFLDEQAVTGHCRKQRAAHA